MVACLVSPVIGPKLQSKLSMKPVSGSPPDAWDAVLCLETAILGLLTP